MAQADLDRPSVNTVLNLLLSHIISFFVVKNANISWITSLAKFTLLIFAKLR